MKQNLCASVLWRVGLFVFLVLLPQPVAAEKDVLGGSPSATSPDLLVHDLGTDFTAYRLDCEVFGWNKDFTQVGAVGTEINRGPRGKHRGEAYLLAYPLGRPGPIHNVIAHNITHADLPHDPLPIEDARDLLWVIENSFLDMWPKRPKRKQPKGAMSVEPVWDPKVSTGDLCTPLVGFTLTWHNRHRFQPFMPLDMKVKCGNLKYTDSRIYWGKADVAAAMTRFDFSAQPSQERSARFVVSASWGLAKDLKIVVNQVAPMAPKRRNDIIKTLRKFGTVVVQNALPVRNPPPTTGELGVARVEGTEAYLDLARYLARTFSAGGSGILGSDMEAVANGFPDLMVQLGPMPVPTAPKKAEEPALESAPDDAGAAEGATKRRGPTETERYAPSAMPAEAPSPEPSRQAAPPKYIKSWDLP